MVLEDRARYIRQYRLSTSDWEGAIKLQPEIANLDPTIPETAIKQFMLIALYAQKQHYSVLSEVTDNLWHAMILDTRRYMRFCERAFGGMLHHCPGSQFGEYRAQHGESLLRSWILACRLQGIDPAAPEELPSIFQIDNLSLKRPSVAARLRRGALELNESGTKAGSWYDSGLIRPGNSKRYLRVKAWLRNYRSHLYKVVPA